MRTDTEMRYHMEFSNDLRAGEVRHTRTHTFLQFLQYDAVTDSWTEIGQMERGRSFHAIVQANLGDVCAAMGNINLVKEGKC